jgi:hypothetical protein
MRGTPFRHGKSLASVLGMVTLVFTTTPAWASTLDAVFANSLEPNRVCLNDGSGGFTCSDVSGDTNQSRGVALGDVDDLNGLDAVFANLDQPNRVCLNDGSGGFTCSDVSSDTNRSFGVALGDVDGVNGVDAVFANLEPRVPERRIGRLHLQRRQLGYG